VELNLAEEGEKNPRWQAVRLLFVRGLKGPDKVVVGKKDWALFLTTDIQLSMSDQTATRQDTHCKIALNLTTMKTR
jgi:hypothetical protein